jgi:hypothetical protein
MIAGTYIVSCSQIHCPGLGKIVDSGIGLSYRPARLHRLAGLTVRDYEFVYWILSLNLSLEKKRRDYV